MGELVPEEGGSGKIVAKERGAKKGGEKKQEHEKMGWRKIGAVWTCACEWKAGKTGLRETKAGKTDIEEKHGGETG